MRTFLFTLFLLLLVGVGAWWRWGEAVEMPSLGWSSPKILPYQKWQQTLIGKWHFEREWKSPIQGIWVFNGKIEYKQNNSFYSSISIRHCSCEKMYDNNLDFFQGGIIGGEWGVDTTDGYWYDIFQSCSLQNPAIAKYDYKETDCCKTQFYINNAWFMGNFQDERSESKIVRFTKNKIVVQGHDFSTNTEMKLTLTRGDE